MLRAFHPRPLRLLAPAATLALSLLASTACSGDNGGTDPGDIFGTYTLRTVNGSAVPVTAVDTVEDLGDGETVHIVVRIVSGSLTLNSNNTYRAQLDMETTVDGEPMDLFSDLDVEGTFAVSGSVITFDPGDEDSGTATISGNTITILFEDDVDGDGVANVLTAVFRK
jgi:hypothetical protein